MTVLLSNNGCIRMFLPEKVLPSLHLMPTALSTCATEDLGVCKIWLGLNRMQLNFWHCVLSCVGLGKELQDTLVLVGWLALAKLS